MFNNYSQIIESWIFSYLLLSAQGDLKEDSRQKDLISEKYIPNEEVLLLYKNT